MFISHTDVFLSVTQQNDCSDSLQHIWTITFAATRGLFPRAIFWGHQANFSAGLKGEMQLVVHLFQSPENLVMCWVFFLTVAPCFQKTKASIHKKPELILKSIVDHTVNFSTPGEDQE